MKQFLQIMFICAVFGFVSGNAAEICAQTEEPLAGGYSQAETTGTDVIAAANYAVRTQAKKQKAKIKLVNISKAEQQVVAGMNYQICLQVETREKGKKTAVPQTVQIVVFQNLKQKYELTSWAIAACAEEVK